MLIAYGDDCFFLNTQDGISFLIEIQAPSHSSLAIREHAFQSIPMGYSQGEGILSASFARYQKVSFIARHHMDFSQRSNKRAPFFCK